MDPAGRLEQRLSSTSTPGLTLEDKDSYTKAKTPDPVALEGGALRPGGQPNLYSRRHIGLLAQYAAIGVVYGSLWGVNYPLLNNFFHMSGVETASVGALLALPWTWKLFFGVLSDCYPIGGYRRRPYIVLGWLVTFVACALMAVYPVGEPYYADPSWASIPETSPRRR
jgi:hypothetical protein